MATAIGIDREVSDGAGRYIARIAGVAGEAEVRFIVKAPALISAEHTRAPDSMRGTGAALALVERMVADARREGFKILAVCAYVRAQLKKHPEWQDVMSDAA